MLNIGSGTAEMREQHQPWIDAFSLAPLRQRGVEIRHCDIQAGIGVDFVGDLSDGDFVENLAGRGFRALLCCNLLEHVRDRSRLCSQFEKLISTGGYIVVTVPRAFPYHPDPI